MIPPEVDLVGGLPEVGGRVLEGFRIEGYAYAGVLESRCHIAYWRMEDQWWRTFADGPTLYVLLWDEAPTSWDAGPEHLYPVEEIAQECYGVALRRLDVLVRNDVPALRLVMLDGRAIECFSEQPGPADAWTSVALQLPGGETRLL